MAFDRRKGLQARRAEVADLFTRFCRSLETSEAYGGTRSQRGRLSQFASKTVARFIGETELPPFPGDQSGEGLKIPNEVRDLVTLLKELTWCYVIDNPALATYRFGLRRVIQTLFEIFFEAARRKNWALFPAQFREEAAALLKREGSIPPARCARLVADTIASMTDQQALRLYQRMTGQSQGSVLDPIVR